MAVAEITTYCKKHKKMEKVRLVAFHPANAMMELAIVCGETQEWNWK